MKIEQLLRREQGRLSPLKAKVLQHLESRPDEVFPYRDEALSRALGVKVSALSFTLWALHRDGLIARETVGGKVYLGSRQAIDRLRRRQGKQSGAQSSPTDPMVRARALRQRLQARLGNIDVLEWLDASRSRVVQA